MSAFEDAVEAAAKAIYDHMPVHDACRYDVQIALDAALPVLLDGLDREALADVLFRWAVPNAGALADEDQSVIDRCLSGADAVIAHLRDEFGVTSR